MLTGTNKAHAVPPAREPLLCGAQRLLPLSSATAAAACLLLYSRGSTTKAVDNHRYSVELRDSSMAIDPLGVASLF